MHLTMTYRENIFDYVGLIKKDYDRDAIIEPLNVWLISAKLPPDGEGLFDKGFDRTDRCFYFLNKVRYPRALRFRNSKQRHEDELPEKGTCCRGLHTSELAFSFLENFDRLKDGAPCHNVSLLPCIVEWGHGHLNLQRPLRSSGPNSGLPSSYWDE